MALTGEDLEYNIKTTTEIDHDTVIPYVAIPGVTDAPVYNLLNGNVEDIIPYFLRGSISARFHWIPVNGLKPSDAIKHVDAFIRSHLYNMRLNPQDGVTEADTRLYAILLGTARAVITTNFGITFKDLIPEETGAPVMAVVYGPPTTEKGKEVVGETSEKVVQYKAIVAKNAPLREILTEGLKYTAKELGVIKVAMRCAQAIIPIQGLNLLTDGHHYISHAKAQSYRAFLAVEKQVWVTSEWKEEIDNRHAQVRDILWHKAGHPVVGRIKETAATDERVKANLTAAKLGSATARLPAVESDVRSAATYIKVADTIDPIWATAGGGINSDVLKERFEALVGTRIGDPLPPGGITFSNGTKVTTREELVLELKLAVKSTTAYIATAYGFYWEMTKAMSDNDEGGFKDTLKSAYSLKRLQHEQAANFYQGQDYYRDFRAWRGKIREMGKVNVPKLTCTMTGDE